MFSECLEVARSAAHESGQYIMSMAGMLRDDEIDTKAKGDFVTKVDRTSEQIIINLIKKVFPNHSYLAEESGGERVNDYCWVIDPLDGTTNFIRGFPVFSVSIALQYQGEVVLGVVHDPNRNETFEAVKGEGAFLNGKGISVSDNNALPSALISTGFPFRQKEHVDRYTEIFREVLHKAGDLRRAGSAAVDLAYVACGRCDGFFEFGLRIWDISAGSLIVKEAGGEVSGFKDDEDLFKTGNIIAGNRYIFKPLKDIISRHL